MRSAIETQESQSLCEQHQGELVKFSRVAHVLKGVVAMVWLPGLRQRFDGIRAIRSPRHGDQRSARPVAMKLEVKQDGGLEFSGAVSRAADGKLRYRTIFRHDLTIPMRIGQGGTAVNPENLVLARRALGLLRALANFGARKLQNPRRAKLDVPMHPQYLVPFLAGQEQFDEGKLRSFTEGMHPDLVEAYRDRLREDLCDRESLPGAVLVNCAIVPDAAISAALAKEEGYEDYAPVLGAPHWNPVEGLQKMPNPATAILAKHGIVDLDSLAADQVQLAVVMSEFRQALPLGERLLDDEVFDALCHPNEPVRCEAGVEAFDDDRVIAAMRQACGNTRAAWEATDADLLRAARNPSERLFLSRLSVTQLVSVDDLHALPAPYAGDFLPPLDWEPPKAAARKKAA